MPHNGDFCARRIRLIYYNVPTGGSLFPGRRKQSAQVKHEYGTTEAVIVHFIIIIYIKYATMMIIIINVTWSAACGGFFTHTFHVRGGGPDEMIYSYYYYCAHSLTIRLPGHIFSLIQSYYVKVTQKQNFTYWSSEFRFKNLNNFNIIK